MGLLLGRLGGKGEVEMGDRELFGGGLLKLLLLGVHSFKIITIINQGY
jgi:hypothetical protein